MKGKLAMVAGMLATVILTWGGMMILFPAKAQEGASSAAKGEEELPLSVVEQAKSNEYGLLAIGVGLAILGGAVGTGIAQRGIGTAVVAACAENRSFLGIGIFLLALPETILIIATGIAYLLLQQIR